MSRDIPIIFSGPMVRALLDGRKTMTRRLAWMLPGKAGRRAGRRDDWPAGMWPTSWQNRQPGDRLWVRESLAQHGYFDFPLGPAPQIDNHQGRVWSYMADGHPNRTGGRPSIYMPRWASRLTLIVTAIKIERLQVISEADAKAEGAMWHDGHGIGHSGWRHDLHDVYATARGSFCALWVKLHGADGWTSDPEVVALTFTVHKQNIDGLGSPVVRAPSNEVVVVP